ncbi:metallophosphoesterase [bacterium]|nr:metallophosphoesterase [bacterium]
MLKKIFILFLFLLFTVLYANAKDISFIQVTDVYYTQNNNEIENSLKKLVEKINNDEKNISFVVFTGNNIESPKPENLADFIKIINKLNCPYYVVLGNSDVSKSKKMSKEDYYKIIKRNNLFYPQKNANYMFKKNGYKFIIANGAKEVIPGKQGYYRKDTLLWIENILNKNKKEKIVILQHFPLIYPPVSINKIKSHETYKKDEYLNLIKKYPFILAIVSGHFHVNWENYSDEIYNISSPSFRDKPHYYKVIDILSDENDKPEIFTILKEAK